MKSDRPKHGDARDTARRRRRVAIAVSLAAMIALSGIACGHQSPTPSPQPTSTDPTTTTTATASGADQYSLVTGAVTQAASGQPYAGATVEFVNLQHNYQLNTRTDESGRYSIQLPAGLYRAEALDEGDLYTDFEIASQSNDTITVPPSTDVDFLESPIQ